MVAFIQNKTWNFTEYKLLNLSIQFKTEFLFSGEIWIVNTIVQEKKPRQMHVVWMMLQIQGALNI